MWGFFVMFLGLRIKFSVGGAVFLTGRLTSSQQRCSMFFPMVYIRGPRIVLLLPSYRSTQISVTVGKGERILFRPYS